ncbi:MAG: YicC/YloC family endoribonuclease [Nitrospinota bacterium]
MTGYGRAEAQSEAWQVVVEVNTINHRYLDVAVQLPRRYMALEHRIRKLVGERFSRGRFDIICSTTSLDGRGRHVVADAGLVADAVRLLRQVKADHGLAGEVGLQTLFQVRDLFRVEDAEEDVEGLWSVVAPVVVDALEALEAMRAEEGRALQADLTARVATVRGLIAQLTDRLPTVQAEHRASQEERIQSLLKDIPVDPQRLAQEVAYLADRSDVTEEVTRLSSHVDQLERLLTSDPPVGRKLDFVLQEMNREVNTVGSKVGDLTVGQLAIEMKHELEKIREQAQNIE